MRNFFIVILIFSMTEIYGQVLSSRTQTGPDYFSTSPNAASLGTYGLIPINLSTGSPNINIDLLKFSTKGKEYNISLTYNLSSVKPEIPVQWTGLGWNLNVGGAITRNLNGIVDEAKGPIPNTYVRKGHYYNYSLYDDTNWYESIKEDMPDTFLFEVNGINGKFYKNSKGKWIISANQDVSFSITDEIRNDYFSYGDTYPDKDRCIYGFEITDKHGNTYTFGKNDNALEINDTSNINSNPWNTPFYIGKFVKSWYLTKIKYADGVTINFEYESDNNITLIQHFSINYGFGSSPLWSPTITSYEKNYLKYLKKITFEEGTIEFNRSLANTLKYNMDESSNTIDSYIKNYNNTLHLYKLDSIILFNRSNKIVDKVEFSYIENSNSRLKLDNIRIGKDIQEQKKYSFSYNPLTMPALVYNKINVDHWGFYNNKNANISYTTPTFSFDMDNYYNLRESDSIAVRAETLERIDYPTGGYNIIEYEPNFYSKYIKNENNQYSIIDNNIDKLTGGLRVKRIKTYESGNSSPMIKRYYYVRDYFNNQNISSGVLSGIPNYIQQDHFDLGPNGGFDFKNLTSTSYIPLSETKGYHIGYSKVYEKLENGGITEYSYSNYDNGFNDLIPIYPSKKSNQVTTHHSVGGTNISSSSQIINENIMLNSLSPERGLLLSKKNYDINKKLLSETSIQYNQNLNRLTDEIRSFKFDYLFRLDGGPFSGYAELLYTKYTPYIIYSNAVQKTEETTIEYFNNGNIETKTTYTFADNFSSSPKTIETSLSDGNITKQTFLYPQDIRLANQPQYYPPPYFSVLYMLSKNMVGVPLAVSNYKNGKFVNRKQTTFEYNANNTSILPKSDLFYTEEKNINVGNFLLPNVNAEDTEMTYDKYATNGNLLQYTTKNGISTVIVWGYNNTKPIAKIEGAKLSDIQQTLIDNSIIIMASDDDAVQGTSTSEQSLIAALDLFRKNATLSTYQITTYTYDPLIGVRSITPPSGITEKYIYDTANRLQKIVDVNGQVLKEYKYNYKN